jgi:hypothetical protein
MKRGFVLVSIVFLILFLSVFVSAFSFGDFWNKITGRVIDNSTTCIDSDNGENYFVTGYRINQNPNYFRYNTTTWDYCIKDPVITNGYVISDVEKGVENCSGDSCYLIEYVCKSDYSNDHTGYHCPNGCKNGSCISNTNNIPEKNGTQISIQGSNENQTLDTDYLIHNGNSDEKLDILFIPFNISNDTFQNAMQDMLYSTGIDTSNDCGNFVSRGLFEVEPFKSNAQKFNVEFAKNELNFNFFNCIYGNQIQGLYSKPPLTCNWDKLRQNIEFEPDIIVIVGKDFTSQGGGHLILMGDPMSANVNSELGTYSNTFVHEFAHSFGGLTDEYSGGYTYNCNGEQCYYVYPPDPCVDSSDPNCFSNVEKNIKITPNEDTLGCPSWCKSYNRTLLLLASETCTEKTNMKDCLTNGCIWFKQKHPWFNANCIPDKLSQNVGIDCSSSCVFSGHYSHVGFSPRCEEGGMMDNMFGDFNKPSIEHLAAALECCFPKNDSDKCREFSERFKNLPSDVNPYFKPAYNFFSQCYNGEITKTTINASETNTEACSSGCLYNNKCLPYGYRVGSNSYCNIDDNLTSQVSTGNCSNNFECTSNICVNSECVSPGFLQQIINFFRNLFGIQ